MRIKVYVITIGLMFFIVLTGCGTKYTKINVGYNLEEKAAIAIDNANKLNLYVTLFDDVRGNTEQHLIGQAKTGTFNQKTPILIGETVGSLTTNNFKNAFSKVGFNIVNDEAIADLVFKGRVNIFWVQEFATGYSPEHCEADVEIDVVLIDKRHDKNLWFDVKKSHIKSSLSMDSTILNEPTMNKALTVIINSVLKDNNFVLAVSEFANSTQ